MGEALSSTAMPGAIDQAMLEAAIAEAISDKATLDQLAAAVSDKATLDQVSTAVADKVTTSVLATALADKATIDQVGSAISSAVSNRATTTQLNDAVADKVTTTALATAIADKITTAQVAASYVTKAALQMGGGTVTQQFGFTGAVQSWVVPAGVSTVTATVRGAKGGGANGGNGAIITGPIPVTAGETLQINCGGRNGFNGGGTGGNGGGNFGGGASDIRRGGTALANRVIIAAGGGGMSAASGNPSGGAGGLPNGSNAPSTNTSGGGGATTTAGGSGSNGGSLGQGGSGSQLYVGGGGGGLYGGGAGNGGGINTGGGGGSSLIPSGGSAVGATHTLDGSITLEYIPDDRITALEAALANKVSVTTTKGEFRRVASQDVADNTQVALSWDTEDSDASNMHDPAVNPTRIILPVGTWLVDGHVSYAGSATISTRLTELRKTGSMVLQDGRAGINNAAINTVVPLHAWIDSNGTDYVELVAFHNVGASLGVTGKIRVRKVG